MTLPLLLLTSTLLTASPADYNGRWNIKLDHPRSRVWWLEVNGAGTPAVNGWFVGVPGGQVDKIEKIRMDGETLVFSFTRKRDEKPLELVYRAKFEGGVLNGEFVETFEGVSKPAVKWTGYRAPEIKDADDGSWKAGKTVALFNGKSTEGWRQLVANAPGWYVENGLLKNKQGASDIVSEAKFWNFVLKAEYRYEAKSNSGIALRGRYEIQIIDDYGRDIGLHGSGGLYSRHKASVAAVKPAGEWQTMEIRTVGRQLTVLLNGVKIHDKRTIDGATAMASDADEDKPGPIGIQGDHGLIEFRKLDVTPLVKR
ncbi:MAG TPA: DUF1080 domain-containing protein [Bryobacteraceae bacterium]|nr:DUF1080 domain-containing protein [Bryobacteraceae bacterium]HPT26820.1 DUF1080 domain-containing protein [Bryobacteraceae bacterium]